MWDPHFINEILDVRSTSCEKNLFITVIRLMWYHKLMKIEEIEIVRILFDPIVLLYFAPIDM